VAVAKEVYTPRVLGLAGRAREHLSVFSIRACNTATFQKTRPGIDKPLRIRRDASHIMCEISRRIKRVLFNCRYAACNVLIKSKYCHSAMLL
jgi:hypothetical protein